MAILKFSNFFLETSFYGKCINLKSVQKIYNIYTIAFQTKHNLARHAK